MKSDDRRPDLPPLTSKQWAAIKDCRFVTPNMTRTTAWAFTGSEEIAHTLGGFTKVRRSLKPLLYDYEIRLTHPDAIALACDLADARHA